MTELPPGASPLDQIGPGTRLREWRVERFVARGAFGRVYEATRASWVDEPTRALKVFDPILSSAAREALIGEFGILREVDHPNLLEGIDAFDVEEGPLTGCVVFVLELADDDLATETARTGVLAPTSVATIGAQVADGLTVLHAGGRLHGDVKPENVLRAGDVWKLGDFGVSAALQGSYAVAQGATLDYRPPELSSVDDTRIHRSTDVWALGVTLWVAATGQHPFVGADAQLRYAAVLRGDRRPRPATIDPRLADLLDARCLTADPHGRADAGELAGELRRLTEVIATEPIPPAPAPEPVLPRSPDATDVSATAALAPPTEPLPPAAGPSSAPPTDSDTDTDVPGTEADRTDLPAGPDERATVSRRSAVTASVVGGVAAALAVEICSLLAAALIDGLAARRVAYLVGTVALLGVAGSIAHRRGTSVRLIGLAAIAAFVVVVIASVALFR